MQTGANKYRVIVFAGLAVVMIASMLFLSQSDLTVSEPVQETFDLIETLDSTDVVLVSFDFEASSYPEMKPLTDALLEHLFSRQVKVVALSLFPEGGGLAELTFSRMRNQFNLEYGSDYVFMGLKPQPQATILGLGQSFRATFPEDFNGRALADLPLTSRIDNYDSLAFVLTIADGSYPAHWVAYGHTRYGVKTIAAVAASMLTTFDAFYYGSHDLAGLLGGLRGAAEYEKLLGVKKIGSRSMPTLSGAHLYVALVIILGNVILIRNRKSGK